MPVAHHREREITFDVDRDWSVPDLGPLVPAFGRVVTATHTLEATYLDTETATLRTLGFTLRRRAGGDDAGWHLKIPSGDARTEVQNEAADSTLPAELARRVAGLLGDDVVGPVATIRTERHTSRVLTGDGALVLEVADDRVTGTQPGETRPVRWREVEVELGPAGTERDLRRVTELFDGARPATVQRKINHVLGEPEPQVVKGRAGLVAGYLREQCGAILVGDVRLRDDPTPEAVHQTRVALRRLRSTLRSFPDVVADVPAGLDDDLRWLAGLLSPIRDGDILSRRLGREVRRLPDVDVVGAVWAEVSRAVLARRVAGLEELEQARTDPRYRHLLATLVAWYASVPVREDGRVRPRRTLKRGRRKVRRRLAAARDTAGLHQARKAAKRLRYAGDVLAPKVVGAKKTAKAAKRLQTKLGDLQDLVVAGEFLRSLGRSGEVESGFTYGVLVARLDRRAQTMVGAHSWRL